MKVDESTVVSNPSEKEEEEDDDEDDDEDDEEEDEEEEEEESELSWEKAHALFLTNPGLNDVMLKGTDGVQVPANRYILAARSKFFRQMFLGNFSEAKRDVVELGYDGMVLKAVVEYLCTNTTEMFQDSKKRKQSGDVLTVTSLVSLGSAAMYFDLPGLAQKTEDVVENQIENESSLSFLFLQCCINGRPSVPENLLKLAWWFVRTKTSGNISTEAVQQLDAEVVEAIVKDDKLELMEFEVFKFLHHWMETDPSIRKSSAGTMVSAHIQLEKIDPPTLSAQVEASGMVTTEQLSMAYKKQALALHAKNPIDFAALRSCGHCQWRQSATQVTSIRNDGELVQVDLLDCTAMKSGVHTWRVELLGDWSEEGSLGFAASGIEFDDTEYHGMQRGGWELDRSGWTFFGSSCVEENVGLQLAGKDRLTFTLDLTRGSQRNGTLSCVKEGTEGTHSLFSNLRAELQEFPEGFAPAVTTAKNAFVRLLSFQRN